MTLTGNSASRMAAQPQQKILIIDDETDVHYSFSRLLHAEPLEIICAESGEEGIRQARKHNPDLIVMDIRMGTQNGLETLKELRANNPRQTIIMMTAYGTSQTAIEAIKLGAYDYVLKPFDIPRLKQLLHDALEAARAAQEPAAAPVKLHVEEGRQAIVGNSPAMQQVYKLIGQVASTSATVLITGESGTGKELVARAIFQNGPRSNKTFIAVNCAAIPENLLESELFGHEKGAFTGALSQRVGKFEQCDGGTLFLDEIGDMPLTTQAKILRVLQDGEISRVGGNSSTKCDVRIIAATNKDLWTAVQRKEFREDLFYRLNVVRIPLPPLRDRLTDVPLLVQYFINKIRQKQVGAPTQFSEESMACMCRYPWPGNVRELENSVQRALVLAVGPVCQVSNLPSEISQWGKLAAGSPILNTVPLGAPLTNSIPTSIVHAEPLQAHGHGDTSAFSVGAHTQTTASVSPSAAAYTGAVAAAADTNGHKGHASHFPNEKQTFQRAIDVLFEHARSDPDLALLPAAERELIVRALAETEGNQVKAAKLLGITRATLRKRVDKFGIQKRLAID
ncbi:MAG: sigma-54-dependent transcriptional regulator [Candidatus Methylacidiphilales bacterium]|nr:sigma-54 dependent transcriptional regulator [Candidatus Methylacidiphilales bacterium]